MIRAARVTTSFLVGVLAPAASAQPIVDQIPGYERSRQVERAADGIAAAGRVQRLHWQPDRLYFTRLGERYIVDFATGAIAPVVEGEEPERTESGGDRRRPRRGRQHERVVSPDGRLVAVASDFNVVLEDDDGNFLARVTTAGSETNRYGTAGWVYGEELRVHDAMWWSPDSGTLAFYAFDQSKVPLYHLLDGLHEPRTSVVSERYPKPGDPNPVVGLHLYDVRTGASRVVETGPADGVGHYVFGVQFSPKGDALIFRRMDRLQRVLEVIAAPLDGSEPRVIVRETQAIWQWPFPEMRFVGGGERFIWETERTGFARYESRSIDGGPPISLTPDGFPVQSIAGIDELEGWLYYTAFSDPDWLSAQLHRVRLDGTDRQRLTPVALHHTVEASPDSTRFVVRAEGPATPPRTVLLDRSGREIATLAASDPDALAEHEIVPVERFTFLAHDGQTRLYGYLYKPSSFDTQRRYPLVVEVYGGPAISAVTNEYRPVIGLTELGCLVVRLENRGAPNRSKTFETATYGRLGQVDLADQVRGVRTLLERPYVDAERVGIHGHSYGGYLAALALLRYPELFSVAVAASAITDWRNYDTIYTERYMGLPADNERGYDTGSCLKHAGQLRGRLLLIHGMLDENVHPSNTLQLARVLQREGIAFDMQILPHRGHNTGSRGSYATIRFLYDELIAD